MPLQPVPKPWAGVSQDFRLFRTDEKVTHGVYSEPVGGVVPTAGVISMLVTIPQDANLTSGHVANRIAHLLSGEGVHGWPELARVVHTAVDRLADLHGLTKKDRHHVANAHSGRSAVDYSHFPEDLFAEYLLTGKVSLHDSGGAVHVEDGHRHYVAYAQHDHKDGSKETLQHFLIDYSVAANAVLDELAGKVLVA